MALGGMLTKNLLEKMELNMKRLSIIVMCAIFLSGCKKLDNIINETFNSGTIDGLEKCIEINKSEILSAKTIGMSCLDIIAREIPASELEATARLDGLKPILLYIRVENNSKNNVFLKGKITLQHYKDGVARTEIEETALFSVEPMQWGGEKVYFGKEGNKFDKVNFCSENDRSDCFVWYLNAEGVSVR